MLLSSMDHLNYYSMPKENFLPLDSGAPDGYDLTPDDQYLNEENSPKNGTKSSLYKTELCKRFSEFGNCRYGAKCQFAHGLAELRHVVRHPKYKTTKCKSYWGSGHCPYGSRCRFIHEEVEGYATPQYSPQGSMSSMFSDVGLSGLGPASVSDLGGLSATSSSYLYGASSSSNSLSSSGVDHLGPHALHHAHLSSSASVPALPSYGKDYSLLASPFDKSAWGTSSAPSRPATKLTYAGDHHSATHHHAMHHHVPHYQHQHHHSFGSAASLQSSIGPIGSLPPLASPTHRHLQSQHAPLPPPPPSAQHHAPLHRRHSSSGSSSAAQSSYPDLQDAIDALMKFSLTQDHDDDDPSDAASRRRVHGSTASPAVGALSSVSSTDSAGLSAAAPVRAGPAVSGASAGVSKKKSPADFALESDELWKDFPASDAPSWSASGLVLNLDTTTPFDVNEKKASSGGSGSEHSPRLSVFERFH